VIQDTDAGHLCLSLQHPVCCPLTTVEKCRCELLAKNKLIHWNYAPKVFL